MSDRNRSDPHPDSPPENDDETERTSVEDVEEPGSPLDGEGVEDGVEGTGGVNKPQDDRTS